MRRAAILGHPTLVNHSDANKRIIEALPYLSPEGITAARTDWRPTNVMRLILAHEAKRAIEEARTELESCTPEDVKSIQGRILGIRKTIAMINSQELQ